MCTRKWTRLLRGSANGLAAWLCDPFSPQIDFITKLAECKRVGICGEIERVDHHPGWNLTFSPPKSVSIAWSNASDDLRIDIESAHREAVSRALGFINDEATWVRVGKGGAGVEQARMIAALFQHSSNRAEEPQLHTHAIVFNVAQSKSDGMWRTLHSRPIYRAYMAAGALYKAEMADRMRSMGFQIHRTKDSFELSLVPATVCEAQSSRSKAIEAALALQGQTRSSASAVTKELLALDTRAEKGSERVVRDFGRWIGLSIRGGLGEPPAKIYKAQLINIDLGIGDPVTPAPRLISTSFTIGEGSLTWQIKLWQILSVP